MAATKGKTSKKTTSEKKQVTKKQTNNNNNQRHIFAGFLLGLCVGMLFFAVYLVTMYCI